MKASLWVWMLQRFSAVFLLLFVGAHFSIMHFVDPTTQFTFATSSMNLKNTMYLVGDSALLYLGLFHGLNGIRNIILDYWPKVASTATWALSLLGVAAGGWGTTALYVFLNTK